MGNVLSCCKNPVTGSHHPTEAMPLVVDDVLSTLYTIYKHPTDTVWQGSTEEQRSFVSALKQRSVKLWAAAAQLNPDFKDVRLNLSIVRQADLALNSGHGRIRLSKRLINSILQEPGLTLDQRLDMICYALAHEMGHSILRHSHIKFYIKTVVHYLSSFFSWVATPLDLADNYWERGQEVHADKAALLILANFNRLISEGQLDGRPADLDMAARLMTHSQCVPVHHPYFLPPFHSHPAREKRAHYLAQMSWILTCHPAVLTDAAKRQALFHETRKMDDPTFLADWELPEGELATWQAKARISEAYDQEKLPPPPSEQFPNLKWVKV